MVQAQAAGGATRVHWVDWLKVLTVAAIFFYHVALIFSITPWLISNPQKSLILSGIAGWGYIWGLQLLFVLAGASSYYARRRRSAVRFAGERLLRLGVPMVLGFVLLSPFQAYFQALGKGHQQTFGQFLPRYLHGLTFQFDPVWLIHTGYHLWFLGFLLIISLAALPIQWVMDHVPAGLRSRWPASEAWPVAAVLLPALAAALFQVTLRLRYQADMSWADLGEDLVLYLGGYALAGSAGLRAAVRRYPRLLLEVAVISWVGIGLMYVLHVMPGYQAPYRVNLELFASGLLHPLGAWTWALFLASVGMRWLDREHPAITYGNDAILPFYVLHHPVVVVLGYYIVQLPGGAWPKFALLFTSALVITLSLYEVTVRHFPPLRFVFGLKSRPKPVFSGRSRPGLPRPGSRGVPAVRP